MVPGLRNLPTPTLETPAGYGFHYMNADGLIHQLQVTDGRITTKSGMSYRVLRLDPYSKHMSLPVPQALRKLVEAGAVLSGDKPEDTPGLADDKGAFQTLTKELFGNGTGDHSVAKGKVYAGQSLVDVLVTMKLRPGFDYSKPESDTRIEFVHLCFQMAKSTSLTAGTSMTRFWMRPFA